MTSPAFPLRTDQSASEQQQRGGFRDGCGRQVLIGRGGVASNEDIEGRGSADVEKSIRVGWSPTTQCTGGEFG